ncbi:hypothetical protein [Helicobacter sp. UBA3407]|uniref:hypothetical protein n=1 Tax=Helicobacter sp. UBA3407 TaxID=1946588 RepID=UPI00260B6900|nr:hypothetical protein [Helicobacter sp. UBA3407]
MNAKERITRTLSYKLGFACVGGLISCSAERWDLCNGISSSKIRSYLDRLSRK